MDTVFNLDRRTFVLVSSTASEVNAAAPSRFEYREQDGVVWGGYTGDTVEIGRFVGARSDDSLQISFVHRNLAGETVAGSSLSKISMAAGGKLSLLEEFHTPDGVAHESHCREL
jgi:hypothetical protein